jgi:uncharacterized protein YecT (DUF1311 family)
MKPFVLLLSILYLCQANPLDSALEKCQSNNSTTAARIKCFINATQRWDSVLNVSYKQLRSKLNPQAQEKLKQAQTAWIAYRDKETTLLDDIFANNQHSAGSIVQLYRVEFIMNLTKTRALLFQEYLKELNDVSDDGSP